MKIALKTLVALITLAVGCLLGMVLLNGLILWKMIIFGGACCVIGQLVYKLLRAIDRRFPAK